jgi:hypothetical protein
MPGKTTVRIEYNNFEAIARQLPDACLEIVADTLADLDTEVKTGMAAGHSGRVYGKHTASSPGEMPAVDMGILIGSLTSKLDKGESKGYYYTGVEYAPYMEFGTTTIAPRPFMNPAVDRVEPKFIRDMKNLEKHLK